MNLRFQKLLTIDEEVIDSEPKFQDVQTFATFNNDNDEIIIERSLSNRFNYQKEIQYKKTLGSDNPLIKELLLIINIK